MGLIRLDMEPREYCLGFSDWPRIPNFSGFVIGVGGKVIFGDPSLMARVAELSLIDLDIEFSLNGLGMDLSRVLAPAPSSSSIIWKSSQFSKLDFSPTGDFSCGGCGTELAGAITLGCLARRCFVFPMMRSCIMLLWCWLYSPSFSFFSLESVIF